MANLPQIPSDLSEIGPSDPLLVLEAPANPSVRPPDVDSKALNEYLGDVTVRSLRALRTQLDRLEWYQAKYKGSSSEMRGEMAKEAGGLARAVAMVTDAVRKREATIKDLVENMTKEERDTLIKVYILGKTPEEMEEFATWLATQLKG